LKTQLLSGSQKQQKYKNGILSGKNTFNDPKDYDGFSVDRNDIDELKEPVIKKSKTQEDFNKELKKNGKQMS